MRRIRGKIEYLNTLIINLFGSQIGMNYVTLLNIYVTLAWMRHNTFVLSKITPVKARILIFTQQNLNLPDC